MRPITQESAPGSAEEDVEDSGTDTQQELQQQQQQQDAEQQLVELCQQQRASSVTVAEAPPAAAVPTTSRSSAQQKKKKRAAPTDEEMCWRSAATYFTSKQQPSAASDADAFGTFIASKLRQIQSSAIRRKTEKELLDVVHAALEQDEQQQLQIVQLPSAVSVAQSVALPDENLLMQIPPTSDLTVHPLTSLASAELLLQLRESGYNV